ncbi:MAG: 23S rRNA (pseudouridine(1915)-N(3))-methyltransferase RlmH [Paracoccaceae bacterium]
MRLIVCAVGRLDGRSEERGLFEDYQGRILGMGRAAGFQGLGEIEVAAKGGPKAEAAALEAAIPAGAIRVALDERGRQMTSPDFARRLQGWQGRSAPVAFLIGGADGLDPGLVKGCELSLSLGKMVWPHKLVRVMLAEQIYRAATILTGHPYHRD